ncbi:putative katanin-like protein, putative,serine peptidase, Clan SJ, family S16 [Trypanosoma rangeli]|uniref:Putative katanin-like protein, putative,serine peptidase, Clan SJ, family S16 n=1 Tax=Trypanosoma rangeli TaxID=5698 RepID=A0A422NLM4_TRYRA|nr:putative katanin-like protein, putative,serine peptidase, Clan SJ, family S16 [Trypanosoma rangeli]RNF06365.1 putative katanin-like protein, putative,serine peptidase, Clan SJ, family S16 [Trypanosoma rangeli]|eukprot:RNF06365.1 putative katanin-like protein, putative,serine peptidase, Clan SJ, family S16 [Trypanosoma rangeli]
MFACLRGIHEQRTAPPSKFGALPSSQMQQRLQHAAFAAVASSEHHFTQLHEQREKKAADGMSAERRLTHFIAHAVQDHLRAVAFEEAAEAAAAECQGRPAATVQAAPMSNAEDVVQLLWMNRTMALGATVSVLAGDCSSNEAPLTAARQPLERQAPDVQKTIRHLRESSPALLAVLLDGSAVAASAPPVVDDGDNTAGAVPDSRRRIPHGTVGAKRPRAGAEEEVDVQGSQPNTGLHFTLKVDGSLLRSRQNERALPTASPSWGNPVNNTSFQQQLPGPHRQLGASVEGDIPFPAEPHAKGQMKLNLDGYGKLSLAQPLVTPSRAPGLASAALSITAGGGAPHSQPSFASQPTASPSYAVAQRTCPSRGRWPMTESCENTAAEGAKHGVNARELRGGICAGFSKKRENENVEATANVGGQSSGGFVTAGEQLVADVRAGRAAPSGLSLQRRAPALGLRRSGFTPPFQQQRQQTPPPRSDGANAATSVAATVPVGDVLSSIHKHASKGSHESTTRGTRDDHGTARNRDDSDSDQGEFPASLLLADGSVPPILRPLDPKLVTQVAMEILEYGAGAANVGWDDIAGLEHAKRSVEEAIVWPLRRPDLFVGLRDPPRGLLLFGPPGTGKTMIARAIANRAQCTFLNISASSLMSKWMGDGEKLVRCLFAVAVVKQPSVIFIDEIDSLLSVRGEGEMDSVRRIKTEFLVQLDGVATDRGDRVLLIGATNRPDELDEAARRRMEKRLYIPLPDGPARSELVKRLLHTMELQQQLQLHAAEEGNTEKNARCVVHALDEKDIAEVSASTAGYSGADLKQVCREAAMGPLREVTMRLTDVSLSELRPIQRKDFVQALRRIRPSVGASEVRRYVEWNTQFGSFASQGEDTAEEAEEKRTP